MSKDTWHNRMSESTETWDEWLAEFTTTMYPVFRKHGIGLDAAVIAYHLNRVVNQLPDIPEEDDWKE